MEETRCIPIRIVDVFTEEPFTGNPAGVVLDSFGLAKHVMQKVAKELNISNTAFLSTVRSGANFSVRFFTPREEIDICGHSAIATFFVWGNQNLRHLNDEEITVKQETGAGVLPVEIKVIDGYVDYVTVTLPNPDFKSVPLSGSAVARALNISIDCIESRYPFQIVYDGLYFLEIGVKDRGTLLRIEPSFDEIRRLSEKLEIDSVQTFSLDTIFPSSTAISRTFFPAVGVNEDPVCGTGNGALASYLVRNGLIEARGKTVTFVGEQGYSVSRPGLVTVLVRLASNGTIAGLRVRGKAIEVLSGDIFLRET